MAEITDPRLGLPIGFILEHRWKIEKVLGENNFGAGFYEVSDNSRPGRLFTLKVESNAPVRHIPRFMPLELLVYNALKDNSSTNAPYLETNGENERFKYVIFSSMGLNLKDLSKKQTRNHFWLRTCLFIAQQSLLALQELHLCGFVHRDIKPANMAVSKTSKEIYLFNFELSRKYVNDDGQMHKPKAAFRGTTLYASVNALHQLEQSRGDDLWAWFYSLVELTTGSLPWDETKLAKIAKMFTNFANSFITF